MEQQRKGNDADAKANAKYLSLAMESCVVQTGDYSDCSNANALGVGIGFTYGGGRVRRRSRLPRSAGIAWLRCHAPRPAGSITGS
jgi:hypothetical protein